uniref:Uncharacterized protein n=1 Tax=Pristionchus pacificus TaxID=54126 RepID=A0A8R1UPU6_PRIPA
MPAHVLVLQSTIEPFEATIDSDGAAPPIDSKEYLLYFLLSSEETNRLFDELADKWAILVGLPKLTDEDSPNCRWKRAESTARRERKNGEWRMENGEWRMDAYYTTLNQK